MPPLSTLACRPAALLGPHLVKAHMPVNEPGPGLSPHPLPGEVVQPPLPLEPGNRPLPLRLLQSLRVLGKVLVLH